MSIRSAQIMLARGEPDAAEAALATAPPDDPRTAFVRARVMDVRGDSPTARETLDRTARDLPSNVPAQVFSGVAALDAGDAPAAEAAFARALALQPQNDLARAYRALSLLHLGDEKEGVAILHAHGFSDNRMFVVRLTEWMETQWLREGRFFAPRALAPLQPRPAPGGWLGRVASERRAERHFFAKRYRGLSGGTGRAGARGAPRPRHRVRLRPRRRNAVRQRAGARLHLQAGRGRRPSGPAVGGARAQPRAPRARSPRPRPTSTGCSSSGRRTTA